MYGLSDNLFAIITSSENIRQAYFDLVKKFEAKSKGRTYRGLDGVKLRSLDYVSKDIFPRIQVEMKNFTPLTPAYGMGIPKKNGGKRNIYIYSIVDRIKAEAIYRVLEPIFDKHFSPFLFSYRASHPSYYAARSAVRRYKRYFGTDHVLVADIASYADTIDHEILVQKLKKAGLDEKTLKLINLFIDARSYEDGAIVSRAGKAILTGSPLYALLANFYMDDFDKWAGKKVALYRRVGDDIIAFDQNAEKVRALHEELLKVTKQLKISVNTQKGRLIRSDEPFNFLGYAFRDGKIGYDASSVEKIVASWKKVIGSSRMRTPSARVKIVQKLFQGESNMRHEFQQLIDQKVLVDDTDQVKALSERFIELVTRFIQGRSTPKNRRLIAPLFQDVHMPTLFSLYRQKHFSPTHEYTSH